MTRTSLSKRDKSLILLGYINGYESGHNDTVESAYTDSLESGKIWIVESIEDGGMVDLLTKYDL